MERATDIRRLQRQNRVAGAARPAGARSLLDNVDSDGEDRPAEDESLSRNSVKRSFLRKVFRPITDYGSQYDLLHFMYDLSLWSDIGAKKAELTHMPMRLALKGQPWTPAFWMARHAALLDLQRQCGPPVLFKTWVPYEWASLYHPWILDMMEKEGRSRLIAFGRTRNLPPRPHLDRIVSGMGPWRRHQKERCINLGKATLASQRANRRWRNSPMTAHAAARSASEQRCTASSMTSISDSGSP